VTRHSLRHPIRGDRRYATPATGRSRKPASRNRSRRPRIRPRKSVNVAALVASPEDQPSRPQLRLQIVGMIVLVLFAVLVLRLWSLQVIDARTYAAAVNANQIRLVNVPAPRGLIVDRNNTVLVGNVVQQQIVLSRAEAAAHPDVIAQVAALVGQTPAEVTAAVKNPRFSPYEPVPVLTNAPPATVQYLEEHLAQYPGVSVQEVTQRTYPAYSPCTVPSDPGCPGTTAPHVLGYVGDITGSELAAHSGQNYTESSQIGKSGIESQYEQYLRGVDGSQALEVDAQGTVIGTLRNTKPVQGDTVVLNLDLGLQTALQTALQNTILALRKSTDSRSGQTPPALNGAAVVLDPQNGQVLAMTSYPTFNLTQWVGGITQADLNAIVADGAENNYAISGEYNPGSTFKLITATAALQSGIISPTQEVKDTGVFTVPGCSGSGAGCSFHDDEASDAGYVNLPEALTKSDDYYFYNLGYLFDVQYPPNGTGPQPIEDTAAAYGEGELTGIDLPGEAAGRVDSLAVRQKLHAEDPTAYPNDTWYVGDNIELAFGQGGTILTPIEQANAYATFANGGTRYAPQVASAVVDPTTGAVVKKITPVVTGHVNLPPSIRDPILQGLQGVITNGTAASAFQGFPLNTFPLAGKTGTSSNAGNLEPTSWFVAFGPLPNPQYVVLAVIDQGGYGATAAAPVVRDAFDYLVNNPISAAAALPSATSQPSNTPPTTAPPLGSPPTSTTSTTTSAGGAKPATTPTTTTTLPGG